MRLPIFFIYGFIGGIVGAGLTLAIGSGAKLLFWQSAQVSQSLPATTATPLPVISAQPEDWQSIVSEAGRSSVAVQTFQGAQLVKFGSGIVVSSDGLVLSTYNLVPAGQTAYQILYGDKIFRATVVARRYQDNLALLKIEGSEFNISNLKEEKSFESGREIIITGLLVSLSKPTPFAQRALVLYSQGKEIVLDTVSRPFLNGAQVIDRSGGSLGIVSLRDGKILLIPVTTIKEFVDGYLSSQK